MNWGILMEKYSMWDYCAISQLFYLDQQIDSVKKAWQDTQLLARSEWPVSFRTALARSPVGNPYALVEPSMLSAKSWGWDLESWWQGPGIKSMASSGLTGTPLAFYKRIWMSSISSAMQEEPFLNDQFQCCQQATEMFEVEVQPASLPLPVSAFLVKSERRTPSSPGGSLRQFHKSPAWPHPLGEQAALFLSLFFKLLTPSRFVSTLGFQWVSH